MKPEPKIPAPKPIAAFVRLEIARHHIGREYAYEIAKREREAAKAPAEAPRE